MKVRTYGLFLMGLAGIAPLGVYGFLAIQESQEVALRQVCISSENITEAIVDRVQGYSRVELEVLATIGVGTHGSRGSQTGLLQAFELGRRYTGFRYPAVYTRFDPTGWPSLSLVAGAARPGTRASCTKTWLVRVFESR